MKRTIDPLLGETTGWVQTASNLKVSLTDPSPDQIKIDDIALALARQPRFNGHGLFFYSVAQHSILVATQVRPENRIYGLLHDAHEAYTGDIANPLKELLGNSIKDIENRLQDAIYEGLGIPKPSSDALYDVYVADKSLLEPEYGALFTKHIWNIINIKPAKVTIKEMDISDAYGLFLAYYMAILSRYEVNNGNLAAQVNGRG